MASVYESIVVWLNSILNELRTEFNHPFSILEPEKIPLQEDYPGMNFQAGGIFSSPNDSSSELIGGQVKYTQFKVFYLRKKFKEVDSRIENEKFFERLAKKIRDRNLDYNLPKDGRDWKSISINSGVYPANRDEAGNYADYLINLKLVFIEG